MNEKKRILVVDDMMLVRRILSLELQKVGYDVILANNGKKALEYASGKNKPSLIISDIMMPEMDGYEMLKQLRESNVTKEIPVILLTGNDRIEDIRKGIELGANDYVVKPYKFLDLLRKIEKFTGQKWSNKRTFGRSKRRFKRFDTQLKAKYFLEGKKGTGEECTIINISRGGMGIKFYTPDKISVGLTVHVEIFVPAKLEPINVKGTLKEIRQIENDFIGGVELSELLDEGKWTTLV